MKTIILVENPFEPARNLRKHVVEGRMTPNIWLHHNDHSKLLKIGPIICIKNSLPLLREHWDEDLEDGDVITFFPAVGDVVSIIVGIIVLIVAVVVSVALSNSQRSAQGVTIADVKEADPVFTLRGQQNQNRLSNPIERIYGRVRHWPSYAAAPYSKFIDNDSWLFQLFCLGHGRVQIEQIYIEDTPLEQFQNVEYEVVEPGGVVTLFPDNVFTSTEVGSIELFGANEEAYTGATSGFVACPPLTKTKLIECDLLLPRGLHYSNDSGGLDARTTTVEFQVREIDDAGVAVTSWVTAATVSKTLATNTPQRFTIAIDVAEARYEVRARRTNDADTSHRASDTAVWGALRAFLPSVQTYPGVTMLVVKAKATNNLNDSSSSRINFSGTSRLRVWSAETGWVADVATRSPVWAFCDVFTSTYGGGLDDSFLDLVALKALDEELAEAGIFFDWVFEQKTTTWEAAKVIAMVARATPMLLGSRVTMVRERPQILPVAVFNEQNIVENSLSWDLKLRDVQDHNGLEMEYLNDQTWQPETVLCLAPGDLGTSLKSVKLPGCTDRTSAYRAGMFMRMSELLVRSNVSFKTGMEGFLPSYGDLIAVNHSFPRWGQGGYVRNITGSVITVSEELTFTVGQTHFLLMRKKDGSVFGPVVVTNAGSKKVQCATSVTSGDFFMDHGEPPIYLFGYAASWGKLIKITELRPEGDEQVSVKGTNYTPSIFAFDSATPPALNAGFFLEQPSGTPQVTGLEVVPHPSNVSLVILTWREVLGALKYVIETSSDGVHYDLEAEPTSAFYVLPVLAGHLWIRVYAVRTGAGLPALWDGVVGESRPLPDDVAGLALSSAFEGLLLQAGWTALTGIDSYRVRVFTRPVSGSYKLARTVSVSTPAFTYSQSNAVADGAVGRECRLLVTGVNITGESAVAAELTPSNAVPAAATGLSSTLYSTTSAYKRFQVSWTGSALPDIVFFRVEVGSLTGFSAGDIAYEGSEMQCFIDVPVQPGGGTLAVFWKVLTKDAWGPELTASSEATITAT